MPAQTIAPEGTVMPATEVFPAQTDAGQETDESSSGTVLTIVAVVLMVALVGSFAGLIYKESQRTGRTKAEDNAKRKPKAAVTAQTRMAGEQF
jgi:flagellar basal body-associated protein FliL